MHCCEGLLLWFRYGRAFRDNYLVPMSAAVWSVPAVKVLEFPVQMLVRFWVNHHLLDILHRPLWRVIKGRSEAYVKRALERIEDVRTSTPVQAVTVVPQSTGAAPFDRSRLRAHVHIRTCACVVAVRTLAC
jgi:predicted NAD/FAD-binding protein